jgi:succinate dehydrogenase / fumarate reductase cytochrome b subunit
MAQAIASIWQGITYRGREGHYAWMIHRVAGLGILLFLFLHILDIFLVGVGEETFNNFLFIYSSPPFKILEMALIFGVVFHAFNGVRIILVDFWPGRFANYKAQRLLFRLVVIATVLLFIPAAIATVGPFFGVQMPWWPGEAP